MHLIRLLPVVNLSTFKKGIGAITLALSFFFFVSCVKYGIDMTLLTNCRQLYFESSQGGQEKFGKF